MLPSSGQGIAPVTTTSEFCDTKKKMEQFEKAGTSTSVTYSGNIKITVTTTTTCK